MLTGIGGESWVQGAATVSGRTGVSIAAFVVGPGRDVLDLYDDWSALSEVSESGCVLVRPDLHVAWRSHDLVADPTAALARVLDAILGRAAGEGMRPARGVVEEAAAVG